MAFSAFVVWLSLAYVGQSWSIGEGTANPGGIEYRYIVKSLIPIGFSLLFLQSLAQAIQHDRWLSGEPDAVHRSARHPDAGLVLRPADGGHPGRSDAGDRPASCSGFIGFGPLLFNLLPHRIFGVVTNTTLLAIPLFVFMGVMLEKSRLAEDLMDVIGHAAGSLRGGLGLGIIAVGVLMGATTGIVGATVVTLGLLTLPGMLGAATTRGLPAVSSARPARSGRSFRPVSF